MKPAVLGFAYDPSDGASIRAANAMDKPWESNDVVDLKKRFKHLHMGVQDELCCYCRRDIHAEFQMVIDIEHVLPASKYTDLRFNILNLSVACKRCNMNIKKENTDFLIDESGLGEDYWNPAQYKLLHPNLDNYEASLVRCVIQNGVQRLVFYYIRNDCPKGIYTKEFFRLREFEMDSFDQGQAPDQPPDDARRQHFRRLIAQLDP